MNSSKDETKPQCLKVMRIAREFVILRVQFLSFIFTKFLPPGSASSTLYKSQCKLKSLQLFFTIKQKQMKNIVFFGMVLFIVGCDLITIEVGPQRKPCTGVAPMMCLQVKFPNETTFGNFYSQIEGWNFVDGQSTVLLINRTFIPNPPMDASSYQYTLVKVVSTSTTNPNTSQNQTNPNQTNPNTIQGTYEIQKVGSLKLENPIIINISNNSINLRCCNRLGFSFALESNLLIKITKASSTNYACSRRQHYLEEAISSAFTKSNAYTFNSRNKKLSLKKGQIIMSVLKKNS